MTVSYWLNEEGDVWVDAAAEPDPIDAAGMPRPDADCPVVVAQRLLLADSFPEAKGQSEYDAITISNWKTLAERFERQLIEAERQRDEALAHDCQPYPTAAAYESTCDALREKVATIAALAGLVAAAQEFVSWGIGPWRPRMEDDWATLRDQAGRFNQDDLTRAATLHDHQQRTDERERLLRLLGTWVRGIDHGYPMKDGQPLGLGGQASENFRTAVLSRLADVALLADLFDMLILEVPNE